MKKQILVSTVIVVVVGVLSFWGGMKYQQGKREDFGWRFVQGQGMTGFGNGRGVGNNGQRGQGNRIGFRPVNGEITASDEKSITVKMQDGSSKIVILSDKTSINKASEGTKEDLKVGEKVAIFGQENSDGTIVAENVQLNPPFKGIALPQSQ